MNKGKKFKSSKKNSTIPKKLTITKTVSRNNVELIKINQLKGAKVLNLNAVAVYNINFGKTYLKI